MTKNERLKLATDKASEAFWAAVVEVFPEAQTGDFLMSNSEEVMRDWIEHWAGLNVPGYGTCALCDGYFKDGQNWTITKVGVAHNGCITKFQLFQASVVEVEDVRPYNEMYADSHDEPVPGRVYLVDAVNKCGLVIESTSYWKDDNPHKAEGAWYLILGNQEWITDNLEQLEVHLFDWGKSAGWCDMLGVSLGWEKWNSGGNCYIWSHEFMDGKSIHVTDECFILSSLNTKSHLQEEHSIQIGRSYLVGPTYFDPDTETQNQDRIAFLLTPHLGQELADLTAKDICFIVENWYI